MTQWDQLGIAWEFTYGSVYWADDEPMDRKGWMGALLAEYKTGWGIPGIYGWYASGDDDDLSNVSDRLPNIVNDFDVSGFSDTFAGPDINGMERDRVIANTLIGTWGVGFRLKNVSFFPDLKHTFHASLWGGTNSSGILEKIHQKTGECMSINTNGALRWVVTTSILQTRIMPWSLGFSISTRFTKTSISILNSDMYIS